MDRILRLGGDLAHVTIDAKKRLNFSNGQGLRPVYTRTIKSAAEYVQHSLDVPTIGDPVIKYDKTLMKFQKNSPYRDDEYLQTTSKGAQALRKAGVTYVRIPHDFRWPNYRSYDLAISILDGSIFRAHVNLGLHSLLINGGSIGLDQEKTLRSSSGLPVLRNTYYDIVMQELVLINSDRSIEFNSYKGNVTLKSFLKLGHNNYREESIAEECPRTFAALSESKICKLTIEKETPNLDILLESILSGDIEKNMKEFPLGTLTLEH